MISTILSWIKRWVPWLSESSYRIFFAFYPKERRSDSEEMLWFRDLCRDALATSGLVGVLREWRRVFPQLVVDIVRVRFAFLKSWVLWLSETIYYLLHVLYPKERRSDSEEMLWFRDLCRDALATSGLVGVLHEWLRVLPGLAAHAGLSRAVLIWTTFKSWTRTIASKHHSQTSPHPRAMGSFKSFLISPL